MRKNIDIDDLTLTKLKIIAAFEDKSVKMLMENAVRFFVSYKEKQRLESLTEGEKEDLGLLLLMQQADMEPVSEEDFYKVLEG